MLIDRAYDPEGTAGISFRQTVTITKQSGCQQNCYLSKINKLISRIGLLDS